MIAAAPKSPALDRERPRPSPEINVDPTDPQVRLGDEQLCRLFVAFPQYRDWLAKSHKATDTYWLWAKIIGKLPQCRLRRVIRKLTWGELPMPPGHSRDELPIWIRGHVEKMTEGIGKRVAEREMQRRRRRFLAAKTEGYRTPHKYTMPELYRRGCEVNDAFSRGEIDAFERQRRLAKISEMAREEV